jgi:hypothetical protein
MYTKPIALVAFGIAISACVATARLTPVTDSAQRLHFHGFSIQPPKGNDWYRLEVPAQNVGVGVVLFHKKLPDFLIRGHTFAAAVSVWDIGERRFSNAAELGARFDQEFRAAHKSSSRYRFLESTYADDTTLGGICVRIHQAQEDLEVPGWRGSVFVIDAHAIRCVHPHAPKYVIDISYSERRLKDDPGVSFETEVEPFLKSVVFTPLR